HVTEVLDDADVLLAIGTALGEVSSNYYTMQPRGQLIQIDAEPRVLESSCPALGIRADAGLALGAILSALKLGPDPAESTWHGLTFAEHVKTVRRQITDRLGRQDLEHESSVMRSIRDAVPDDAHTFWDMTIAG